MAKRAGKTENLKPVQSKEEARERGKKGGIRSGQVRREKKSMRELAQMLLNMPAPDSLKKTMEAMGISKEDQTYKMALLVSMTQEAIANRNVQAGNFVRDTAGEKPIEQINLTRTIDDSVKEMEEYFNEQRASEGTDKR